MLGLCRNYFSRYGFPHVGISRRDQLYLVHFVWVTLEPIFQLIFHSFISTTSKLNSYVYVIVTLKLIVIVSKCSFQVCDRLLVLRPWETSSIVT